MRMRDMDTYQHPGMKYRNIYEDIPPQDNWSPSGIRVLMRESY